MIKDLWKREIKNEDINFNKTQMDKAYSSNFLRLSELECGNQAKVIKLQGSPALKNKLQAMGIYTGTVITKKSAIPAKGPIIISKGSMEFALGYDIAEKILVDPV